ncbi:naphthalene 1,2-dioxygenase system ferredoxin subunit [bacterium BMS3Bbin14]|nr:naphthalene 1,2-dioxygenase system ferredoxin subunit [bacterium BMS3Bbin14]
MDDWLEVPEAGNLARGSMKEVSVGGREILLVRSGETYYAADNRCSHLGGKLSEGDLDGTVVTCPLHGSRFDVADGTVVRWLKGTGLLATIGRMIKSPQSIRTYPLKMEDDRLLIRVMNGM